MFYPLFTIIYPLGKVLVLLSSMAFRKLQRELLPANAVSREVKMKLFSHTMQVEKLCKTQYAKAAELVDIYAEHGIRTVG